MAAVGDILTGKRGVKPASIRVLGVETCGFVVEDASDDFTAPYALTPAKLAAEYGGDPSFPLDEQAVLRAADIAATEAAADVLFKRDRAVPRRVTIGDDLRAHVARRGHNPHTPEEQLAADANEAE